MPLAPTLHCPCGGRHLAPAFSYDAPPDGETRFDLGGSPYRRSYKSCTLCGHWFGEHDLDLSQLYESDYVDATYGGPAGMAAKLKQILALPPERSDNAGRVARILAFAAANFGSDEGRRVLDVGAGLGVFPAAMKAAGWTVTGVEPDTRTAEHLRRHVGIEALSEDLADLSPERTGRFEVITFNKVLEHVEDPVSLLARARDFLAPDGICYVEVPDVAAAADGPGREEFFVEHHHVFSAGSLVALGERAGMAVTTVERLRELSGKFTLRGFLERADG